MLSSKVNCIILAAGLGKRMKTLKPKVLCNVLFKPMINWVLESCENAGIKKEDICIVLGYKAEEVKKIVGLNYTFTYQEEQKGTGDAVKKCLKFLEQNINKDTLILCGDSPFIDETTIENAYNYHSNNNASATVITAELDKPFGYGRILKDKNFKLLGIVEEKEASKEQKEIKEINSGAYFFNTRELMDVIEEIDCNNSQGEFYLTDTISLLINKGKHCQSFKSENPNIVRGANTKSDLLFINKVARTEQIIKHIENGVEFLDDKSVYIEKGCKIGEDTFILPNVIIKGKTIIGKSCTIGPNSVITNSIIKDNVNINSSTVQNSEIERDVNIGPFSNIRPNSKIKKQVKIGDFVEIKSSIIGEKSSIAHLSYIGDADIGRNVNIGGGVITVNYDGQKKHKTEVGNNSFIGCNTNIIAPRKIEKNSYVAAGSTITKDVKEGSLAIERATQKNKEGWVKKRGLLKYKGE